MRTFSLVAVLAAAFTATSSAAQRVVPYPVPTGAVQVALVRGGLHASFGAAKASTPVTRAMCFPAGPVIRGVGYIRVTCTVTTPHGSATIIVSSFTRNAGQSWFYRWKFAA